MDDHAFLMRPRLTRIKLLSLTSAALLIAAACSGTPGATVASPASSASAASSVAASEAPSTAPSVAASEAPSASAETSSAPSASSGTVDTLAVDAADFSFGLPASVPAGPTHIVLTNTGKEAHQAQIARLNSGKTFADLTKVLQNPDPSGALALVTLVGGPTSVQAGQTGAVDLMLEPGTHVFLCFLAGADQVPHIAKGMIAPLEVTAPATAGSLPAGDAKLTLKDFSFVGLDKLTAGKHTIAVTNDGPQPHEAGIVKLADGVTVPDVIKLLSAPTPPAGGPPWTEVGGIAGIAPGSTATMDVDLPAGNYAFICFIPDPATGKSHLQLGMIGALTVE